MHRPPPENKACTLNPVPNSTSADLPACQVTAPDLAGLLTRIREHEQQLSRRFPDLDMQLRDPAPARLAHDRLALDPGQRFPRQQIVDRLIAGPAPLSVDREHALGEYALGLAQLGSTLSIAYDLSATFRRLFNQAWDTDLKHPDRRCLLHISTEASGLAVTGMRVMELAPSTAVLESYQSHRGPQPLSWARLCLQEVIGVLTGLPGAADHLHPRGAIVEYANIVLKEMGCCRPACSHLSIVPPPPSGHEVIRMPEQAIHLTAAARQQLARAQQLTQDYLGKQLQPDRPLLHSDMEIAGLIISHENARKPGLNLFQSNVGEDMMAWLAGRPPPFHLRAILRDRVAGLHHVFADIDARPGLPLSLILIESASLKSLSIHTLCHRLVQTVRAHPHFTDACFAIFNTGAQKSNADCLIFCMSFALKSHRHAEWFSSQHQVNRSGPPGRVADGTDACIVGSLHQLGVWVRPSALLPADFFKHAHSGKWLDERLEAVRDSDGDRNTLIARRRLTEPRELPDGRILSYLPSIEYKRHNLVARVLGEVRIGSMRTPDTGTEGEVCPAGSQDARQASVSEFRR